MSNISSGNTLLKSILYIAFTLVFFLLSIDLLITSLSYVGKDTVGSILGVTANPFVSLFIGLLTPALIQSSSTSTSMIVALVASGSIDMQRAIPIIMGANIGTTLTSKIVSLSFITKKQNFRRAFSTATLHDHFNILVTIILFPLQYRFNLLGRISDGIATFIGSVGDSGSNNLASGIYGGKLIISEWVLEVVGVPAISLIISIVLLFTSIKLLTKVIYKTFIGASGVRFEELIFNNRGKSFAWGLVIIAVIQSSSLTSSVVVPLVATGRVKFRSVYPFIIGANIGTTITALLASLFKTQEALSIAVAHLMFNLIGGLIFLLVPGFRNLPILLSGALGNLCLRYRVFSIIYIIITFFLLPFVFNYVFK